MLRWQDRPTKEQNQAHTLHTGKEHPGHLHYLFTGAVPQQTFLRVSWAGPEISTQDRVERVERLEGEVRSWKEAEHLERTRIMFSETEEALHFIANRLPYTHWGFTHFLPVNANPCHVFFSFFLKKKEEERSQDGCLAINQFKRM